MTRRRKSASVIVQHADIDDERRRQYREQQKLRQTFEQRERARLGLAPPRASEPTRKAPTFDRDVRRFIDRGFSEELAKEMAQAMVPHDARSRWGGDQI
jgi:hypothetical protein